MISTLFKLKLKLNPENRKFEWTSHLKDTIQKLESLRQKQNAEIDELIISLHTQATIDTGRAGMTTRPAIPALQVNDEVQILNTGKYCAVILARKLSRLLLHPAETKLQDILANHRITNNPVMPADVK